MQAVITGKNNSFIVCFCFLLLFLGDDWGFFVWGFTVTLLARLRGLSGSVPLSTASWYARVWIGIIWVMGLRPFASGILMKKSNTGLFLWLTPMM